MNVVDFRDRRSTAAALNRPGHTGSIRAIASGCLATAGLAIGLVFSLATQAAQAGDLNLTNFNRDSLFTTGKCPRCNLQGNDFSSMDLSDTDLRGADLRQSLAIRANLRRANLSGADLRGAFLWGADMRDAVLDGANLCGAIMPTGARSDFGCAGDLSSADLNLGSSPAVSSTEGMTGAEAIAGADLPPDTVAAMGLTTPRTMILALDPVTRAGVGRGAIALGGRDRWAIEARPGTMVVELRSQEGNARFDVVAPDGRTLAREARRAKIAVPRDGRYDLVIGSTRGNTEYEVVVSFE